MKRRFLFSRVLPLGAVMAGGVLYFFLRQPASSVRVETRSASTVSAATPVVQLPASINAAPDAPSLPAVPAVAPVSSAPATPPGPGIVAEWSRKAPVSLRGAIEKARAAGEPPPGRLPLILGADEGVMLVRAFTASVTGGGVFTGEVENRPGSTVVLSYEGNSVSGVVLLPGEHRSFNYRAGDDGLWRITELDTLHAPDCGQQGDPQLPPKT